MKYNINGLIISDLMVKKNFTASSLARKLDMTRANVQNILKRDSIKEELVVRILDVLGYSIEDVEEMIAKNSFADKEEQILQSTDSLMEILKKIEVSFSDELKAKNEELKRKDEQISQLLQTNNALVMAQLGRTNFNLGIVDTISSENEENVGKIILFTPLFEALVVTA
ncbi:helix-turn-helix domain-containing protein [Flectobacillus roseus]|uniref:helix-turn-helix domain-containing protein n=1 Tax=Flectobacillus roseus TaxID=502259 RepID=UPI0024B8646A|nr:helix-turn-helix transcriptional regulator [Flectobacillus roseus]MDI9871872.1 helix-turn-helix transcriptional regulator [Flectobacillus roseus]